MFVDMARKLGQRVVTDAEEARRILGIKLTSAPTQQRDKVRALTD